jgi:hypothetical protein
MFLTISRSLLLIIGNISDKICTGNQNKFPKIFPKIALFFPDSVEKNGTARQAKGDNIIWRMRIVC